MAYTLKIDLDELNNTIQAYEGAIIDFETSIKNVDTTLSKLKASGWKSGASTAYFLHYEDTWKENMKKHIKIIKHMKDCLIKARSEYTNVKNEYDSLKYSLD